MYVVKWYVLFILCNSVSPNEDEKPGQKVTMQPLSLHKWDTDILIHTSIHSSSRYRVSMNKIHVWMLISYIYS